MKRKRLVSGIGASIGMLILILDGKTALDGARTGIELCLKTVIPSLFPFFLLSMVLTSAFLGSSLGVLRPLGKLCGIPKGGESLLISGLLGGYPVGAQSIAAAYRSGQLSREEAQRLLSFCNNAGPAFLFGMVAAMFLRKWMAWALWGIHLFGAVLTAILIPGKGTRTVGPSHETAVSLSEALNRSVRIMASVCGWVVLFRVVIAFLRRWVLWLLPASAQVAIIGLLELSNGCCELLSVSDVELRFVICSGLLAFGGLCVTMQTFSVTAGLSLRYYFLGKLLQTAFSVLLAGAVVSGTLLPCCGILLTFSLILRKTQKRVAFPEQLLYNKGKALRRTPPCCFEKR